jgi:dUTP pyrophosphatase
MSSGYFALKIFIQPTSDASHARRLRASYGEKIRAYMAKVERNEPHLDSGFDLLVPKFSSSDFKIPKNCKAYSIDHRVVCVVVDENNCAQPFYLYPRSSISGTPLRLANSVGIIDSGYRGNLVARVDNIGDSDHDIEYAARLFQVCSRTLAPFRSIEIIDRLDFDTARGAGGFGSTGGTSTGAGAGAAAEASASSRSDSTPRRRGRPGDDVSDESDSDSDRPSYFK